MPRLLEVLEVPTGDRLLDLLPRLRFALDGGGPALLPVPADHPAEAGRLVTGLAGGAALASVEDDAADPTAVVIGTSGSTGTPKGALLPVSALIASADATRCALTCTGGLHPHRTNGPATAPLPTGTWLLTLPAHHIAGLQVLLRAVAEGTEPAIMDTALPFTATAFADAVGRMPSGRRFVSLVPTQLHRILADPAATTALGTFAAVLVGGASTPQAMVDDARQAGVSIVTTYGMSETCGGCVYDGVPLDLVSVSIDSDGRPLGGTDTGERQHRPGRVSITGPMVARGYRDMPFHPAFVWHPGEPYRTFITDDLAQMAGHRVRIVGRIDDVIVTGGVKIDPAVVESVLVRVAGVADVVITGVPDEQWGNAVVAVVQAGPDATPDLATIRAAAAYAQGPAAAPKHLVLVRDLPRRGPGKPDRAAIGELARRELARREPTS
jgi:O-succinylbenzoic acid--CoA ligase